jgi:hypothetical protein
MDEKSHRKMIRNQIKKNYRIAVLSYSLPFISLFLYMLDSSTFNLTGMYFFVFFLLGALPLGIVGLFFTVKGLIISRKSNDYVKKDIGYANLTMGIIMAAGGMLGFGFMYVMVN